MFPPQFLPTFCIGENTTYRSFFIGDGCWIDRRCRNAGCPSGFRISYPDCTVYFLNECRNTGDYFVWNYELLNRYHFSSIMEKNHLLAATRVILVTCLICMFTACKNKQTLTVGIAPYQDIAMIVNVKNLELEKKYGTNIDLVTMNWEDILPAVASSGKGVDVGFGSLTEYLTKEANLNADSKDPVLFVYPAYIFKGGSFVTFNKDVPELTNSTINDNSLVSKFFSFKIGAQKNSIYQMMLYSLARRNNLPVTGLKIFDTPLNDGILAAQGGSLDIAEAGLTQLVEAKKNKGRIVLDMDNLGFADIVGFICKKSVYETRKDDINNLVKMWYESVNYVFTDVDKNSKFSLSYLDKKAAAKYTLAQYKDALSQEAFPRSIDEAEKIIVAKDGQFSLNRISGDISYYLMTNKVVKQTPMVPQLISIGK